MPELDAMLRMLSGSEEADRELLKLLGVNGSGDEDAMAFEELLAVRSHASFIIYARHLRCLGHACGYIVACGDRRS